MNKNALLALRALMASGLQNPMTRWRPGCAILPNGVVLDLASIKDLDDQTLTEMTGFISGNTDAREVLVKAYEEVASQTTEVIQRIMYGSKGNH